MEEEGASRYYPPVITAVSSRFAARIGRKTRFWRILPVAHLGNRAIESRRCRPVGRSCGDLAALSFVSQREKEREREEIRRKPGAILARAYLWEETDRSGASFLQGTDRSTSLFLLSSAEFFIPSFCPLPLGLSLVLHGQRCHIVLYIITNDHDQATENVTEIPIAMNCPRFRLNSVRRLRHVNPSDVWNKNGKRKDQEKSYCTNTLQVFPRQLYKLFSRSRES